MTATVAEMLKNIGYVELELNKKCRWSAIKKKKKKKDVDIKVEWVA